MIARKKLCGGTTGTGNDTCMCPNSKRKKLEDCFFSFRKGSMEMERGNSCWEQWNTIISGKYFFLSHLYFVFGLHTFQVLLWAHNYLRIWSSPPVDLTFLQFSLYHNTNIEKSADLAGANIIFFLNYSAKEIMWKFCCLLERLFLDDSAQNSQCNNPFIA